MSSVSATSGLTFEEWLNLPDERRYKHAELIDGELRYKFAPLMDGEPVLMDPPAWLHQHVVGELHATIRNWIRAGTGRGCVTREPPVRVNAIRSYLPDVAWYCEERGRPKPGNPYLTGPPDLAIEVLFDSTRAFDLVRKRADYAKVGVGELWLVDPEARNAWILRPPAEAVEPAEFVVVEDIGVDGVLTSPQLPGLKIPFVELLPD
jgi:Uma2 family endonuclease